MKIIKAIIGFTISIVFLWLSLKDVRWVEVKQSFQAMNYFYIIPVCLAIFAANYFRAIRWRYMLVHIKRIPVRSLFEIIMISNLLLNVLPARIGDVIRAYLIGRKYNISKMASFSTVVIERVFDGIFTIMLFVLVLWLVAGGRMAMVPGGTDSYVTKAIVTVCIIFTGALGALLLMHFFPDRVLAVVRTAMRPFPEKFSGRVDSLARLFIQGLGVFGNMKNLLAAILITVIEWNLVNLSNYLCLLGFGIGKEFLFSFILLGFIIIAVMIPAAPGFVGTYHYAVQLCLVKFYDVSSSVGMSYAWVTWFCSLAVNATLGFIYYNKYHLTLDAIKNIDSGE
ncbi:MAG: hypothetical protein A2W19_05475 [Spirochaetes bacterium RBG_16_49_21]|nr:MAG: hypothetical protein A2W19_05475 [Spirochaetes bacterium RBG_16_49_21]